MLKRISEAISQSNIVENLLASETYRSHRSFCNFSALKTAIADYFHGFSPFEGGLFKQLISRRTKNN